jgi:uncharacterized integral membrane protein (TIGR00698 family)
MTDLVTRSLDDRLRSLPGWAHVQRLYPGLLAAGTIGLAATWLGQQYKSPVMLFALLIGMAFHFLYEDSRCAPGIEVASKTILRIGVALLGARITAEQIVGLGAMPLITVVVATGSTILFGVVAARWFGLSRRFGVLSGGAVGICGASAALAISSVLPPSPERERDTIVTVVTVTALSTLAMILYPMIVGAMHLGHAGAGIFLGGTIHDVAQVEGAGYTISAQTGDIATYVKLLRVSLLLPIVFTIALSLRGQSSDTASGRLPLPVFLIGFIALVVMGSVGLLPKAAVNSAGVVSRWCLVTAVSALGVKTSFGSLAKVGWRPIALMVAETAWIGAVVLCAVLIFSH